MLTWTQAAAGGIISAVVVNAAQYGYSAYIEITGRKENEDIVCKLKELQRQLDRLSQRDKDKALDELKEGGARIEYRRRN